MHRSLVLMGCFLECAVASAQVATNLAPVVVREIARSFSGARGGMQSLGGELALLPRVAVNGQGLGSQRDISIRGGSFSGAGLSLSGLPLANPQTEHFNAELPLPAAMLSAPAVLTGLDQARETPGFLSGAVALDLAPITPRYMLNGAGGNLQHVVQNALVEGPLAKDRWQGAYGAGLYVQNETANGVDYPDNDFHRQAIGVRGQRRGASARSDVVLTHAATEFGARGYYGVNPGLFADEKVDDTLALASHRWLWDEENQMRVSGSWRQLMDDYRLFWTNATPYANHNRSQVWSGLADGRHAWNDRADFAWRVAGEDQILNSSNLGDQRRQTVSAMVLPGARLGALYLNAGLTAEGFTGYDPAWLPLAGVEWAVTRGQALYVSYSESVRLPSFTELNYDSPGSLGNQGLSPQHAQNVEAGWKGRRGDWHSRVAVFGQRSRDTVDWVYADSKSTRWVATNLGTVDTLGLEGVAGWSCSETVGLELSDTWLHKRSATDPFASRYVLDYPENLAKATARWQMGGGWTLTVAQGVRWQTASPVRTSADFGAPAEMGADWTPRVFPQATVSLQVQNLWNDHFQPVAGLPVPGRTFLLGLTVAL